MTNWYGINKSQIPEDILKSFWKTYEYIQTNEFIWEITVRENFKWWSLFTESMIRRLGSRKYQIDVSIPKIIFRNELQNLSFLKKTFWITKKMMEISTLWNATVDLPNDINKERVIFKNLNSGEWHALIIALTSYYLKLEKENRLQGMGFIKDPNFIESTDESFDGLFNASELQSLQNALNSNTDSAQGLPITNSYNDWAVDQETYIANLISESKNLSLTQKKDIHKKIAEIQDEKLEAQAQKFKTIFQDIWNTVHLQDKQKFIDIYLPYNQFTPEEPSVSNQIPSIEDFGIWTLDSSTKDILNSIGESIEFGESLLLEWPTAASKTSSIRFMAYLTNTPCIRIPFTAVTTTDEIIWKFIPFDLNVYKTDKFAYINNYFNILKKIKYYDNDKGGLDVKILSRKLKSYLNDYDLSSSTKNYLNEMFELNPDIDYNEIKDKAISYEFESEGYSLQWPFPKYLFKEGSLTKGVKLWAYIILDEMNLAPADQLERMNEAFDDKGEINLVEYDGKKIKFHPETRLFATMNPATYSWRKALSPALKNRFTVKQVSSPDVQSYKQMIEEIIDIKDIWIKLKNSKYALFGTEWKKQFNHVVTQMAWFHKELEVMLDPLDPKICIWSRELPVVTRRDIIKIINMIDLKFSMIKSLEDLLNVLRVAYNKYYVSKFREEKDKNQVSLLISKFFK